MHKHWHRELTPLIWSKVVVHLSDTSLADNPATCAHLQNTSSLRFVKQKKKRGTVDPDCTEKFERIICACRVFKMRSLTISQFTSDGSLELAAEVLVHIERLTLHDITEVSIDCQVSVVSCDNVTGSVLGHLSHVPQLERLSLCALPNFHRYVHPVPHFPHLEHLLLDNNTLNTCSLLLVSRCAPLNFSISANAMQCRWSTSS